MKDKEYALNIQLEELKSAFEAIKTENIKLKDNLEAQNKLWKIWLETFDDKNKVTEVSKGPAVRHDEVSPAVDVEQLDDDGVENADDLTDMIFKNYMDSLKESSNRKSHSSQPIPKNNSHNVRQNSSESSRAKYCHYWSNYGTCHFVTNTGRPCKFKHERAPTCKFDGKCDRQMCMYTHKRQNVSFLLKTPLPMNSQQSFQRGQQRNPSTQINPWQIVDGSRRSRSGHF